MLTDKQMHDRLSELRTEAMGEDNDYSEAQSRALQKIMDAIDILSSNAKAA